MLRNTSKSSLIFRLLTFVFLLNLSVATLSAQVESKANDLLRQMTIEEKVAQLTQLARVSPLGSSRTKTA